LITLKCASFVVHTITNIVCVLALDMSHS